VGSGLALAAASDVAGSTSLEAEKKAGDGCGGDGDDGCWGGGDVGLVASCIHEGVVTMTLTGGLRPHGLPSAARVVSGLPLPVASDFERMFKQQVMA
jgi:hypothetical protein